MRWRRPRDGRSSSTRSPRRRPPESHPTVRPWQRLPWPHPWGASGAPRGCTPRRAAGTVGTMSGDQRAVLTAVDDTYNDAIAASARAVVVRVDDLVKRYPKRPTNAVDGVSFAVGHGEVFGLLGPNGAGKTTTVGVLTTRVRPTGGYAEVAGIDVVRDPVGAKRRLAVVPQRSNLDRALS